MSTESPIKDAVVKVVVDFEGAHFQQLRGMPLGEHNLYLHAPGAAPAPADDMGWWRRFCLLERSSFVIGALGGVKRVSDKSGNWIDHEATARLVDWMQTEINMLKVNVTVLHGGLTAAVELMEQEDFATLTLVPRLKQVLLHQNGDTRPCAGRKCGSVVDRLHSAECFEDHERVAGAVDFSTIDLSGPLRAVKAWLDDDLEMETEERWEVCNRIDAILAGAGTC